MKVLMINEVCGVTSTGRICTDIADILTQQGHTCKIAYGYGRHNVLPQHEKYAIKIGNKIDVYSHALLSRIFDNTGFYSQNATKKLVEQIKSFNPDIIHLHNLHGYYINIEILFNYLKEADKPVLWTLHDCWTFTGHCTCYDYYGCDKWITGCHNCNLIKEYPASLFVDNSKNNYRRKKEIFNGVEKMHIATPSKWLKKQVEKSFLGSYPVTVVNSGIDLSIFKPVDSAFREKYGLQNKKILLGVANAWSVRKGINDFIKLANELDESYKVVIVGDLREFACPDNIVHIPHTDSIEELAQIYSEADVFLNLSYEETQGLTTIEAMACGTPVVVYNKTAIPECVTSDCGVVVDGYDFSVLKDALEKAMTLSSEACVKNASNYPKKECFERYVEMYEDLVK